MKPKDKNTLKFAQLVCAEISGFNKDGTHFPYLGELSEDDTIRSILQKVRYCGVQEGEREGRRKFQMEMRSLFGFDMDENEM